MPPAVGAFNLSITPKRLEVGASMLIQTAAPVRPSLTVVRVVLGEHVLVEREGLRALLATEPEVEVVATAGDLPTLQAACEQYRPDVVMTGMQMAPSLTDEGVRLSEWVREREPRIGVVVVSDVADAELACALLAHGCAGRAYLLKDHVRDRSELTQAIQAVASGSSVVDPKVVERLVGARTRNGGERLRELTPRERAVLERIATGDSNEAIARALTLTKRAVEKHINAIFLKLGLTDAHDASKRVAAALIWREEQRE